MKTQDRDVKKRRRAALSKMVILLAFTVLVWLFLTIAWFTNNKEVSESGLQMTAGGIPFTIEFPGEDEGHWIDQYHNLSNQTGIWLVDDDKNMDNGSGTTEEKLGLEPGDSGTLEFRISPNETDTITVDICFTMRGIMKQRSQNSDSSTSSSQQLTEISDTELMGFVASHMSVIETAKRNGLNVFGYLSFLMLVLPSWGKTPSEEQLDSIMPWSETLPETCYRTYHQIVENEAEVKLQLLIHSIL